MRSKQLWFVALLTIAGVTAEPAFAQVRVTLGIGGSPYHHHHYHPRYYHGGPSIYVGPAYYGPRVIYASPPPAVIYARPPVVVESPPAVVYSPPPIVEAPTPTVAPVPTAAPAHIRVLVPDAGATVWFDGSLTKQNGTERMFHTPDLPPAGSYAYRIRAAWLVGGQQMVQERVVSVTPGQTATADFRGPVSEAVPTPR